MRTLIILFCSIFFLLILYAVLKAVARSKITKEFKQREKELQDKTQQLELWRKNFDERIYEVNNKEKESQELRAKALATTKEVQEVKRAASNKVVNMEMQIKKLQSELNSARQNIKRRKRQLQELKE